MSDNQKQRNAQAGQRQREHVKTTTSAEHREFSDQGLTKRNEEFMFQLKRQLAATKFNQEKQDNVLADTLAKLQEGQKTGKTARNLFGTPSEYVTELVTGPKRPANADTPYWQLAVDNGVLFFTIFTLLFGFTGMFSGSKSSAQTMLGITTVVLIAVIGGLIFAGVSKLVFPTNKKSSLPIWQRILVVIAALIGMLVFYWLAMLVPRVLNPVLQPMIYIVLGLIGFIGQMWFRRKYQISGGFFGGTGR